MPGSKAFIFRTGGSARRREIKPEGQAPSITFRVSGVPGHTHNSCAVASVLCNLERQRGFAHNLTDAWADHQIEMLADDIGDSEPVPDEDARFDHALERGIGEMTLIPENCHQQIREPTRAIAEVRHLCCARDKFDTMTYVEEVGGFVDPRTGAVYISDFPDVLVDMIGPASLNSAPQEGVGDRYTGELGETPVSVRLKGGWRDDDDDTGYGHDFVLLQQGTDPVGTLADGSAWNGVVSFRWIQAEKLYRSESFTVTLTRAVEVGPKPDAQLGAQFHNGPAGPLTVTFPIMQTTVASNGYCFLMDDLDATTVLLGATHVDGAGNGDDFNPIIRLKNVSKPGLLSIGNYDWVGSPAYRILVGGNYALSGPPRLSNMPSYFEALRNMKTHELANSMRNNFHTFLGDDGNWEAGNNDIGDPLDKFDRYFMTLRALGTSNDHPQAGLPRNAEPGSTWYPLKNNFPSVIGCQQVLGYDGTGVDDTGNEVVREILESVAAAVTAQAWAESDITFETNKVALQKVIDISKLVPPAIQAAADASPLEPVIEDWYENVMPNVTEAAQAVEEQALQGQIDLAQAAYDAGLAAGAPNLPALLATLQGLQVQMQQLVLMRVPDIDNWYSLPYNYNGRVQFSKYFSHTYSI